MGGGNLLIAMGLFATLNYLGKIYWLLRGEPVFTKGDEAKKALGKLPAEIADLFSPKRDGFIDETLAFKELIEDASDVSKLGLQKSDIVKAYTEVRHKLTHMIAPRVGNVMLANISKDKTFELVKSEIYADQKPSFSYQDDGVRLCDVDRLNRDVSKIRDWLVKAVENGKYDANIDTSLAWVEKALG
jgi:hypothetical protein